MENAGIFMAIWTILQIPIIPYTFCGYLVYFPQFWYILSRTIWQPSPLQRSILAPTLTFDQFLKMAARQEKKIQK
jgi:hypothetical protein